MNRISSNTKKWFIVSVITVILIILTIVCFDKLIFRQTSSDPNLSNVATSSVSLKLSFSQPIKSVEQVSINEAIVNNIVIDGSTITIPLQTIELNDGQNYTLQLKNIHSAWFGNTIKQISSNFTSKYVEYSQLSEKQQNTQVNRSNSGQVDDPFLNNTFPLLDAAMKYQINANTTNGIVNVNVTFLDEVPNYDKDGVSVQLPDNIAEEYRNQALQKIKDNGGSPDKYNITYSNNYLNSKYSAEYHD